VGEEMTKTVEEQLLGRTWVDIALDHHLRIIALEKRIEEIERTSTPTMPIHKLQKL
jgi:hypothetical protein